MSDAPAPPVFSFLPWFTLQVSHSYYTDGQCADLQIVPGSRTQRALEGLRGMIRTSTGRLDAMLPWSGSAVRVPPPAGFQAVFWLVCTNPYFPQFTQLDSSYGPGKVYQYQNSAGTGALTSEVVAWKDLPKGGDDPPSVKPGGMLFGQILLQSLPAPAATAAVFNVSFSAASLVWSYYVVGGSSNTYNIVDDSGRKPPLTFNDPTQNKLNRMQSVAANLAANMAVWKISSASGVTCSQHGYAGLTLNSNGHALLNNLANPTLPQNGEVVIHAGGAVPAPSAPATS